jgi:hypothetical protein
MVYSQVAQRCLYPYQRLLNLPSFHPTSKKAYVEFWVGMKYGNILALHILLSQTMDPRRKMSYNQIMMWIYVEMFWWLT